jgi:hypothetical protein
MFGRRRDGTLADVAPYRRIMPFLMRGRNESIVLFEQRLDLSRTNPWLDAWRRSTGQHATVFHLVLHALARMLHERPRLNRFVAGRRLYDRRGVFVTFAAKKAMHDDAPLATVKRAFAANETFAEMVAALTADVRVAKSDQLGKIDRELSLLAAGVAMLRWLDAHGLAPRALIGDDPMYTSVFVSNLGSLRMDAAYHHLYEYGNCPLFCTIGRAAPTPIVSDDGTLVVRPTLLLRYSYDERVEDGFYAASAVALIRTWIEDPASWIG